MLCRNCRDAPDTMVTVESIHIASSQDMEVERTASAMKAADGQDVSMIHSLPSEAGSEVLAKIDIAHAKHLRQVETMLNTHLERLESTVINGPRIDRTDHHIAQSRISPDTPVMSTSSIVGSTCSMESKATMPRQRSPIQRDSVLSQDISYVVTSKKSYGARLSESLQLGEMGSNIDRVPRTSYSLSAPDFMHSDSNKGSDTERVLRSCSERTSLSTLQTVEEDESEHLEEARRDRNKRPTVTCFKSKKFDSFQLDVEGSMKSWESLEGEMKTRSVKQSFSQVDEKRRQSAWHAFRDDRMGRSTSHSEQGHCADAPSDQTRPPPQSFWREYVRSPVLKLINHKAFETFVAFVILSNAVFIGVQVDYMVENKTEVTPVHLYIGQIIYCILFVAELSLRSIGEGRRICRGTEMWWTIGDIVIVVASVLEVVLEAASTASIVRLVRVVRVARILRIIRTIRIYRALRILVYSIFSTLRQLVWTLLLILIIMYMFGIVFTQAAGEYLMLYDHEPIQKMYGTLPRTIYTLFKAICGGVDWEVVAEPLSDLGWIYVTIFMIYIAFMYFAVLNVVVGVFCNSAIENANKDQDAVVSEHIREKNQYVTMLKTLFQDVESMNYGVITLHDLEKSFQNPDIMAWFAALGLEVSDAWTLFKLLDTQERGVIEIEDFVEGCLKLKGSARSLDMARMMYENRWIMNKLVRLSQDVLDTRRSIGSLADWTNRMSDYIPSSVAQTGDEGTEL